MIKIIQKNRKKIGKKYRLIEINFIWHKNAKKNDLFYCRQVMNYDAKKLLYSEVPASNALKV